MKKRKQPVGVIHNRRARFDYELSDSLVVGLVLNGRETKSLRHGHGNLRGAYVTVKNDELWLINATITGGRGIVIAEEEVSQARKILAKKREIEALVAGNHQGRSIIPTEILTRGRYIKLRISLGRGKKHYDKRETIKKREQDREARRQIRA